MEESGSEGLDELLVSLSSEASYSVPFVAGLVPGSAGYNLSSFIFQKNKCFHLT
jgi:hypothetical protein